MSPFGQDNTALAYPYEDQESYERETFFRILFHDDRDSYYFISTLTNGLWVDRAFKASTIVAKKDFPLTNCYVTRNGYNSKSERSGKRIRQFNSLLFDLDCHEAPAEKRDACTDSIIGRIFDGVTQGILPMPTLIVDSGRGVQVYYVLQRSIPHRFVGKGEINEKGISFYKDVYRQLSSVFDELMDGLLYVDVDKRVFDDARVGRIPGTYNTKAGRNARLVYASEHYYHLPDLASYKPVNIVALPIPKATPASKPRSAVIIKFNHMLMSRLNKVVELQEYRGFNCAGSRELMSFVFYNTAVQLYSREDARQRLLAFNSRFVKPLPNSELNGVVRSVDSVVNVKGEKGHYVLKAETLVELLSLTEKEMLDLNFFASKRMVERMEAKRKTREKRNKRNESIIALYSSGQMTQVQVAESVGCSLRTVQSVLKQAGKTRQQRGSSSCCHKENSAPSVRRNFSLLKRAKFWRPSLFKGSEGDVDVFLDQNSVVTEFLHVRIPHEGGAHRFLFSPSRNHCISDLLRVRLSELSYPNITGSCGPQVGSLFIWHRGEVDSLHSRRQE